MGQVERGKRRVWQRRTYIWVSSAIAIISALIYLEQTALLFVLSTVAMCALLIIVAISNLEGKNKALLQHVEESRNVERHADD